MPGLATWRWLCPQRSEAVDLLSWSDSNIFVVLSIFPRGYYFAIFCHFFCCHYFATVQVVRENENVTLGCDATGYPKVFFGIFVLRL